MLAAVIALLASCGGGDASRGSPAPLVAPAQRGTLLQDGWSAYPRLVRLGHQSDSAGNGVVVASVTERVDGRMRAGFHASRDGGTTFQRIGTLDDAGFASGLCCGTLFELPQAVGVLAAGTLLYAASVGADVPGTQMEQPIFASNDGGATFQRIAGAACGRAAVPRGGSGSGVWEPEFLVAADGSLACVFSDETEPGKSQVLKLTRTLDGATWSAPETIVAGDAADRPGMAVIRRLADGRYAMSFELCSSARLDCSAHLKLSKDGLHWGPLGDFGTRPQTAAGQFLRHAPTLALARSASAPGALVLVGQLVAKADGSVDVAANGRTLFVSASVDGSGAWTARAAPIALPDAPSATNWCQNYSSPLLPSDDSATILMMQTDSSADGGCVARFGSGSAVE
ncbi:MAG: exo-alpha-sialidase [Rhizobacter sp.]|nr:exo-alpha-sialidase [Rhizobacter sp.]